MGTSTVIVVIAGVTLAVISADFSPKVKLPTTISVKHKAAQLVSSSNPLYVYEGAKILQKGGGNQLNAAAGAFIKSGYLYLKDGNYGRATVAFGASATVYHQIINASGYAIATQNENAANTLAKNKRS